VVTNFNLYRASPSRKYGLAMFIDEQLKWTLVDQSPEESETEQLRVGVQGYNINNVYKPPPSHFLAISTFRHLSL